MVRIGPEWAHHIRDRKLKLCMSKYIEKYAWRPNFNHLGWRTTEILWDPVDLQKDPLDLPALVLEGENGEKWIRWGERGTKHHAHGNPLAIKRLCLNYHSLHELQTTGPTTIVQFFPLSVAVVMVAKMYRPKKLYFFIFSWFMLVFVNHYA